MTSPCRIFFLAAFTRDSGLTSMALGLAQALQRDHVAVGFIITGIIPYDRLNVPDPIAVVICL